MFLLPLFSRVAMQPTTIERLFIHSFIPCRRLRICSAFRTRCTFMRWPPPPSTAPPRLLDIRIGLELGMSDWLTWVEFNRKRVHAARRILKIKSIAWTMCNNKMRVWSIMVCRRGGGGGERVRGKEKDCFCSLMNLVRVVKGSCCLGRIAEALTLGLGLWIMILCGLYGIF